MKTVRTRGCAWLLIAALSGAAACGDPPTTPTPTPTVQSVLFASRLVIGGSAWKSFTVATAGTVTVRLATVSPEATAVMRIGLGTFNGTACATTQTIDTGVADTDPQITTTLAAGNYCVLIWDIGNLTKLNDFFIIVSLPAE